MTRDDTAETTPGSGEEATFFFVGGALALDFVNTEVVIRGKPRDLLDAPGAWAAWWRAAGARYPEFDTVAPAPALADTTARAMAFRAELRRLFGAVAAGEPVDPAALDALNGVLDAGRNVVEMVEGGGFAASVRPREEGPDAGLVPIAWSALEVLARSDLTRLHACANERCTQIFHDATKSGTRRWCSVGCMNRARSAERYRAAKRGTT
jgi:predicted RNA-binding Zn ribbon-like protein